MPAKEDRLLRVGVLGCGPIAQAAHFESCTKARNATLYAICDVADDLRDALYDEATLGKPAGQDAVHARPSAVAELGVQGATRRLSDILGGAIASIPACPGEAMLADLVRRTAERMTPVAPVRV
jgi:geranylgeranyl diphosphate synthase type II